MENEKVLEFFELYNKYIHRDGSDKLLDWIKQSDFLYAPASTRFHGNTEFGLVTHSLNVYHCLKRLLELHGLADQYSEETVAICALMHDCCKANMYVKDYRNVKVDGIWTQKEVYTINERAPLGDHADKSVIILQQFIKLSVEEIYAIRAHMGGFDNAVKGGSYFVSKVFEQSKLALLLHLADMEATYLYETTN